MAVPALSNRKSNRQSHVNEGLKDGNCEDKASLNRCYDAPFGGDTGREQRERPTGSGEQEAHCGSPRRMAQIACRRPCC